MNNPQRGMMVFVLLFLGVGLARASELPKWEFDSSLAPWKANADLAGVKHSGGAVEFDAPGSDGFLSLRDRNIPATPWQYLRLRLKADRGGEAQLFWSGTQSGPNGGLTEAKSQHFAVTGDGQWHDYLVMPGWQGEGTIRQLRFDLYRNAHFALDRIEICSWGGPQPLTHATTFTPGGDPPLLTLDPGAPYRMAPPLNLPLAQQRWVAVQGRASAARQAAVLWTVAGSPRMHRTPFNLRGDGAGHVYNIDLSGDRAWGGNLVTLGVEWPVDGTPGQFILESLTLATQPAGPPDLAFDYVGFENALNRPGRPCRVLAKVLNRGGAASPFAVMLKLPAGLRLAEGQLTQPVRALMFGESEEVTWPVMADRDGPATITVSALREGPGNPPPASAGLCFDPPLTLPKAAYVPPPRPIETVAEVCMYYFPGWDRPEKWLPVRRTAPIRKPVLGWYDEGNPECVDWQIKWARENGISCFLLDWYWNKGSKHLDQWLNAYRRARYRDRLKIAIMWANHNPPGSHSRQDWRVVTQWWIDNVFGLPAYFKVGGLPAVFIWTPDRVRGDLGGSAAFKAALEESQALARKAGYGGIAFFAVNENQNPTQAARLAGEGFVGAVNYHEFAKAPEMAPSRAEVRYENVVATSPAEWERRQAAQGPLAYYPLIDTGWDARPWHGDNTMVVSGRAPDLWERLLRAGLDFQRRHSKPFVVFGPANEWGEGSYIEPNLEFGFGMYEKVRAVFGKGDPSGWPKNFGPVDVGLGPYDLPAPRP